MGVPKPCFLWPLRFALTSYAIKVTTGATTEVLPFPAAAASPNVLTVDRNYWMAGDGQGDTDGGIGGLADLLWMLQTALNAHTDAGGALYTVSIDAQNRVTISVDSGTFQLHWNDAATTLDGELFGAPDAIDPNPAAASSTFTRPTQGIWYPQRAVARDSRDRTPVVATMAMTLSGDPRTAYFGEAKAIRDMRFAHLALEKTVAEEVAATDNLGTLEDFWRRGLALGRRCRYYPNAAVRTPLSPAPYKVYRLRETPADPPWERMDRSPLLWETELKLVRGD